MPEVREESVGDQEDPSDAVFSNDRLHTIDIRLTPDAYNSLLMSPYSLSEAAVTIDGYALEPVGVRLRGKIGSFRVLSGKPKFRIDFNAYTEDQRFFGLEGLNLNNGVVDCSFLKEPLGYLYFLLAGVPSLRTSYAKVTLNGMDYGLYMILEEPDDRFLNRTFTRPDGNLYDGKYVWYGDYNYTLLDFNTGVDNLYQLEEGTDVGNADIQAVSLALASFAGTADFYAELGKVINWSEYHRELAVEQWVGHNDGYALNTNNYRPYFNPEDGLMQVLPWDLDYGFLNDSDWGMSWASPRGQLAYWCFQDATCYGMQKQTVSDLLGVLDTNALLAFLSQIDTLTLDATLSDPRRECGVEGVVPSRDALRAWVQGRSDYMRSFWGI